MNMSTKMGVFTVKVKITFVTGHKFEWPYKVEGNFTWGMIEDLIEARAIRNGFKASDIVNYEAIVKTQF